MLRIIFILIIFANIGNSIAQTTFSKRLPVISGTVFYSVNVIDDGYLIDGGTIDSTGGIHPDLCIVKLDPEGEVTELNHFGEFGLSSSPQYHSKSFVHDLYLQHSVGLRNDTACVVVSWHNSNCDTLRTRYYRSPYIQFNQQFNTFINPLYSVIMPDSSVYLSTVIAQPGTANDVCIWKLDPQGNELWHYIYATEADPETCYAMVPADNGIIAAVYKGDDQSDNDDLVIIQLDSIGNLTNEVPKSFWNEQCLSIRDMLHINTDLFCAGGIRESAGLTSKSGVWKLNENYEQIWISNIGDYPEMSNGSHRIDNIVQLSDNNLACSDTYLYLENESTQTKFRISKLNIQNGDIIWTRYYQILENTDAMQRAFDLKATPDGGVVFCGEATDYDQQNVSLENPIQQGWICKLDACGCLVPSCDENCIVGVDEATTNKNSPFLVGPNPAADFLNIYLKQKSAEKSNFRFELTSMEGKTIKSFVAGKSDTTYLLDVSDLASGNYLLTMFEGADAVVTERVVVGK